ncbi:Phytanoyl-CoA dioxygenase [Balamuthia mandrillaris]
MEQRRTPEAGWSATWSPLPRPSAPNEASRPIIRLVDVTPTAEDVATFKERGYWVGPKMLADQDIACLRQEIDRVFHGELDTAAPPYEYQYWLRSVRKHKEDSPDVRKINNSWWNNLALRQVVTSPAIGRVAAALLETTEVRLWHDQAIWKPGVREGEGESGASTAGNIGWHQDYAFWQISDSANMCTAWIALQDTDLSNGGLRTIAGSHKWGLVPDSATFFEKDMDKLKENFARFGDEWQDEPCIMKAGQVAFHHSLTFHGSGANLRNEPRLAIAVHMMGKGCRYRSGFGWHHNAVDMGPFVKDGDPFEGARFPLLYATAEK